MLNSLNDWRQRKWLKRTEYFREYKRRKRKSVKIKENGSLGECLALILLKGSELVRKPTHDIEWKGLRVEVKTALPKESAWEFHSREKQLAGCDYFFLVCLNKISLPIKYYLVPQHAIKTKTIYISNYEGNQYARYLME